MPSLFQQTFAGEEDSATNRKIVCVGSGLIQQYPREVTETVKVGGRLSAWEDRTGLTNTTIGKNALKQQGSKYTNHS